MIDQEREDELLDHSEDGEILVRADLVEDALLVGAQRFDRRGPGEALGHEAQREVELLVLAKDVVELPLGAKRRSEGRFIIEVMVHENQPFKIVQ
jgi:hypothetical protein